MSMPRLPADVFKTVVGATPLVSIDLICQRGDGCVLLGQRVNRPAQGTWFVPGGRIVKNETLDAAFARLTQEELGTALPRAQARLLGVYEHFYDDSVFGPTGEAPSTHYVVLGYALTVPPGLDNALPKLQHSAYRWQSPADVLAASDVHENTKAYFRQQGL
jgi:colanic acid biosynthesis protein WcaH